MAVKPDLCLRRGTSAGRPSDNAANGGLTAQGSRTDLFERIARERFEAYA
jgi:hypothetical protein